jgi:hypothetical protein
MHIQFYYIIFKYRSATNENSLKGLSCITCPREKALILCHVTLDTPVTLVTSGKPRRSFLVSFLVLGPGFPVAVRGLRFLDKDSELGAFEIVDQRSGSESESDSVET